VLDLAWYAVLLVAEFVRPRLRYDVRRWATVFPLGMTAAATLSVSSALDVPWLDGLGEVLLWIAVAAWLAVAAGMIAATRAAVTSAAALRDVRSTAPR
jgi:tellurite resistance protein TehA-like permease